jgi:hypothetical protein
LLDPFSGEVTRVDKLQLEMVKDEYDKSLVPLQSILDQLVYEHGRVRPHERILCWFPKFLDHFCKSNHALMNENASISL